MSFTLISFGANLGNSHRLIQMAGEMVQKEFGVSNVAFSRMYRSPAVGGPPGQDDFYNAVARVESSLSPFEVWQKLHQMEQTLGRRRRLRWEARPIDLDVLMHQNDRIWTPTFKVPHPRMALRTFIVEPAADIAPDWIEPVTEQTLMELALKLRTMRQESSALAMPPFASKIASVFVENRAVEEALREAFGKEPFDERHNLLEAVALISVPSIARPWQKQSLQESFDTLAQHLDAKSSVACPLVVFAGASPDATTVHWEDYCRGWAIVLGLTDEKAFDDNRKHPHHARFRRLPKYLLAANDPKWAAHELKAVLAGMRCSAYACGTFFDGE